MRQIKPPYPVGELENEYLKQVLKKLHTSATNLRPKKIAETSIVFYFQNAEDLSGAGADGLESAFQHLKKQNCIQEYSRETGSKILLEEDGHGEDVYYLKYSSKFIPQKITGSLEELSVLPKYFVRFGTDGEKDLLTLNDTYILSSPRYGGAAYNLLEIFIKHPRERLPRLKIEAMITAADENKFEFKRRLAGILIDLGFKKEIGNIFFPRTSQEAIYFRNDVFANEIRNEKINFKGLKRQVRALRRVKK